MGTTHQLTDHRSFTRLAITLLATLSLLASQVVAFTWLPTAQAAVVAGGVDAGGFEIDGNFTVDGHGTKDWASVQYTRIPDGNTVFGGGSNAQEPNRQNWSFQSGTATPPKDNLLRGYVDAEIDIDGESAVLRVAAERDKGNGTAWASFEFNQANAGPFVSGTSVPRTPSQGDLLVSFQFPGNDSTSPEVLVDEWVNGSWSSVTVSAFGATNLESIVSIESSATLEERELLEVSVDVSAILFGPDAGCRSFGQTWVRSNTAYGDNGQLKDVLLPVEFDIDTCASLVLRKVDTAGNPQAAVTFALYEGTEVSGDPVDSCTTGIDGACAGVSGLEPGTWTAYEVAPPPGFRFDAEQGRSQTFTLGKNEDRTVVFANPPISYRINVTPEEDTNAVGFEHEFEVELFTDFIFDYDGGNSVVHESNKVDIPLAGATVQLAWVDGPDGSSIVEIRNANGTVGDLDTTSTSCTTDDAGTCTVTVLSNTVGGPGTLQATFATPLSGPAASGNATDGGYFSSITDSGDKSWIGYVANLAGAFTNPLGEDHTFTVSVDQVNADGSKQLAGAGVDVTVAWSGPAESAIEGAATCTTGVKGTCDITVASPSVPGTGTLSIVEVEGEIVDGETLTIEYGDDAPSATKTWIAVDVTVSGDAVNNLGADHVFTVTVTVDDGREDAPFVVEGAKVEGSFDYEAPDLSTLTGLTCTTDASGECDLTVAAPVVDGTPVPGEGTLTVTHVSLTFTEYSEDWKLDLDLTDEEQLGLVAGFETPSSTKIWAAYTLTVTPPNDMNLLPGNEDHSYTVTLSSDDTDALPVGGQELDLALASSVLDAIALTDADGADVEVPVDASGVTSFTCTTLEDGTCVVTVTTAGAGTATLTADYSTEIEGEAFEADQAQGDKLWTTYRIRVENSPAVNLLGTPHVFDIYLEKTDGERDDAGELIWFGVDVDGEDLDISLGEGDAFIVTEDVGADDCAAGTDEDGRCTVTVDSVSTGLFTLTVGYTASNVTWAQVTQTAGFSETGTKQWIDFQVTVSPDVAENLVDTDHVFEVLVEADLGEGFGPVEDAMPEIDVEGAGTRTASVDPALPDCADGTGADGACYVTITSSEPGMTTVTATYEGSTALASDEDTVGEPETADFADSGDKLWVDYLLGISEDAINALDDPHEFTITLLRDEGGSAPQPAADQEIDLTLEGVGTITSVVDGEVADDGSSATCTTDEDGTCVVTIVSSVPGTSTLTATYDAVVGGTSGTFTDEGVKQWAAISLVKEAQIEPDENGLKIVTVDAGGTDTVSYDYTITNTGPVALTITELDDDVIGPITLPEGLVLEPGASTVVSADYIFTAEDIQAGVVVNIADVVGVADDGTEVTDRDDEAVFVVEVFDLVFEPGIEVVKEALIDVDEDGIKSVTVGDDGTAEIVYRYTITNTGDAALFDVTLVDDVIGDLTDELSVTILAVGESTVVEVPYTTTAAELAVGRVDNIATTTGTTIDGAVTEAEDDETVFLVEVLDFVEPLPRTGADTWLLTAAGLLLTLLGAATLLLGTRRRQHGEA